MEYILIEETQDQFCEIWVILGSHTCQPGSSYCGAVKCVTLLKRNIALLPISFEQSQVGSCILSL